MYNLPEISSVGYILNRFFFIGLSKYLTFLFTVFDIFFEFLCGLIDCMYPSFFHFRNNATVNCIDSFQYLNWVGCDTSYLLILIIRDPLRGNIRFSFFILYNSYITFHQFPQVCVHLYLPWSLLLSQTILNHISLLL